MIKAKFIVSQDADRPITENDARYEFPYWREKLLEHNRVLMVAFANDEEHLKSSWTNAEIQSQEEVEKVEF